CGPRMRRYRPTGSRGGCYPDRVLVAFWVLAAAALALAVLQLVVALRLRTSLRPSGTRPAKGHGARPPVSVLVPLKGAPAGLEFRLRRLLANLDEADQLVLAMETEDDPAHAVARALQEGHPDRDVTVVLSGPAGERMGKQHNLAAALPHARHEVLAFADDDVHVERAHLEE